MSDASGAVIRNAGINKIKKCFNWKSFYKNAARSKYLYLMIFPTFIYLIIFNYVPMYGAQIAFRDFNPYVGVLDSPWVGMQYFKEFFASIYFYRLMRNTLVLSITSIIFAFPAPIILALMINEVRGNLFKKSIQTVVYLPHFISIVVVAGMVITVLSPNTGVANQIIQLFGGKSISFMSEPSWFPAVYVGSAIWQTTGWGSIIYLAAITGIDPSMYESAVIDGASRYKQILHITIPSILPTIVIMLIMRIGGVFSVGYEKVMLLYNPLTYETADVVSTYVYRRGLQGMEYSFASAVGLFNSVLNLVMIVSFNAICKKLNETSLW